MPCVTKPLHFSQTSGGRVNDKRILILGVGNILLTDEGFGVRAVEYLKAHYRWPEGVRLMDGGTQGLMLMPELL